MAYGIETLNQSDERFPDLLREIPHPPKLVYARGNISLLKHELLLAVVGSRKASTYGKQCTATLLPPLVQSGIVLVSGLAYGIDTLAHKACTSVHRPTIAVLGTGIDDESIYPRTNLKLAYEILEHGGLLISEYPPGTNPMPYHFPERNRIIAGLCRTTLIIQATTKSGSLITGRLALESNRNVCAVPGPITDTLSQGTNEFIKQGAYVITGPADILALYNIAEEDTTRHIPTHLTDEQNQVFTCLSVEPQHVDAITLSLSMPPQKVSAILLELELEGLVQHAGSMQYIRT